MSKPYQCPPPNCVQIEAVEGCPLACWFCALQVLRDNGADRDTQTHGSGSSPYKFLTLENAELIAQSIALEGWRSSIVFAMHGEPTMHKQLPELIAIFRKHLPKNGLSITSNGAGLVTDTVAKIEALFAAGLNVLMFDDYEHADYVSRIRPMLDSVSIPWFEFPKDKEKFDRQKRHGKHIMLLECITHGNVNFHKITNQGGNSGSKKEAVPRRCAKPFREMSIRWDGNVAVCCDDWPGTYKLGNVLDIGVEAVWNHERMDAARRRLYLKQRDFGPCRGCNVKTFRDGLLPDKFGKDVMPLPDEASAALIKEALAGEPYTAKVKRTRFAASNDLLK